MTKIYPLLIIVILLAGLGWSGNLLAHDDNNALITYTDSAVANETGEEMGTTTETETDQELRGQTLQKRSREQREVLLNNRPAATEAIRTEKRVQQAEKAAERQVRLSELRREKISRFADRMFQRIEAALTRIERLANRLENRLDIFDGRGANTGQARTILFEARVLIDEGRSSLNEARTKADELLTGEINRALFAEIRTLVRATVDRTKAAQSKVVEAIAAARGASENAQEETSPAATE